MATRIRILVAAAAALALTGCGGSGKDSSAQTPPPPAASTAPEPTATASASPSTSAAPSPTGSSSASPSASPTSAGLVIHIDLVDGKPKTRPEPIVKVKKGDEITIVATADKFYKGSDPYEIHVHGFDYKLELTPGQPVTKTFTADQPAGTYEVEIENTSAHLFNLQIR